MHHNRYISEDDQDDFDDVAMANMTGDPYSNL
jgi:hypothetical protein